MTRYTEELAWCKYMLLGTSEHMRLVGRGNEADYLEVQAAGARRNGDRQASIAFQAAANHWRDQSKQRALEILCEELAFRE